MKGNILFNKISYKGLNNMNNINDSGRKNSFDIMPLDINIAKIQFNLLKRCEYEIPENGTFSPIRETYDNKDRRVNIGEIQISCEYDPNNKDAKQLIATISDVSKLKKYKQVLCFGSKNDILTYLKSSENYFFDSVKTFAQNVSDSNEINY